MSTEAIDGAASHGQRYSVVPYFQDTSAGGYDCWLVIDSTIPKSAFGHDAICECNDEGDARMIAESLNRDVAAKR